MINVLVDRFNKICLLQIFIIITAHAQEPAMRHFTTNDGLASSTVYYTLCDTKGFLWFCTEAGVSRYDGHQYTNFTISDGLSSNEMLREYEDAEGRIWFLGFNGTLSNFYNGKFYNPSNDSVLKKAESKTSFRYFFEDKRHRLWFTADNEYIIIDGEKVIKIDIEKNELGAQGLMMNKSGGGVYILTPTSKYTYPLRLILDDKSIPYKARYKPIPKNGFCHIPDGGVLFRAKEGLVRQIDTLQELILPFGKEFEHVVVNSIFIDGHDKLWIATLENGVFCYDYKLLHKLPARYLKNKATCDVHEDLEGNIWISTLGDGIYMLPREYNTIKNYSSDNGLTDNLVFSVAKDSNDNIYAGMNNGNTFVIYNGVIKTFIPAQAKERNNRVVKIITHGKQVWVGSSDYLMCIDRENNTNRKLDYIHPVDKSVAKIGGVKDISLYNESLAVCVSHYLYQGNPRGWSPLETISNENRRSYCVFTNHDGIVWYGAQGGLYSFNGKENVCHFTKGMNPEIRISSIAEMPDSVLVLATYGDGIFFFRDDKIITHITQQDGLSSNICRRIFVYDHEIYIATNNGANRIVYNKGKAWVVKKYTIADGLLSNDVNDIFVDDSNICFATCGGLSVIDRHATTYKVMPPPVYINSISNNGRLLSIDSSYIFNYQQDALHIEFIGCKN